MAFGPAITATIGADVAPLQAAGPQVEAATGKIAGGMEKKFLGTHAIVTTLATAFGLNMEKMAQGLARMATGVSEEAEKSWDRLVELSDAATATVKRTLEVMRGESQRMVSLEVEQNKLIKEREGIYAGAAKAAADYTEFIATINERVGKEKAKQQVIDENAVRLAEIKARMEEIGLAQETERARLAQKAGDEVQKRFEVTLRGKTLLEQLTMLAEREAGLQEKITAFKGRGYELDSLKKQLAQTTAGIEEASQRRREEGDKRALEIDQESAEYEKAHHEQLLLEAKLKTGTILPGEMEKLKILRLQNKEKEIQIQLSYLLSKPMSQWTQEDHARFILLQRQSREIEAQIKFLAQANAEVAKTAPIIEGNIAKWREFVGVITNTGRSDSDLSDRELQRKAANLRADIFQRQQASNSASARSGAIGAAGYDALLAPQQLNLDRVLATLRFREDVRRTAATQGEDAAFSRYPGLTEQKLREILGSQSLGQAAVDELKELNGRFATGNARIGTIPLNTPTGG